MTKCQGREKKHVCGYLKLVFIFAAASILDMLAIYDMSLNVLTRANLEQNLSSLPENIIERCRIERSYEEPVKDLLDEIRVCWCCCDCH